MKLRTKIIGGLIAGTIAAVTLTGCGQTDGSCLGASTPTETANTVGFSSPSFRAPTPSFRAPAPTFKAPAPKMQRLSPAPKPAAPKATTPKSTKPAAPKATVPNPKPQQAPVAPTTPAPTYSSPAPWWMFGMGGLFGYGIGNGSGVCN